MIEAQDVAKDTGQGTDRTGAEGVLSTPEPLLTIAQAAKALRLDPKQIRRYADKLTGQDRTAAGQSPVRVRLSAVIALRERAKSEADAPKDTGQDSGQDTSGQVQDSPSSTVLPERPEGTLPALVYQQRIADLEAMNSELKADKERLYGLLETAQENLSREQALRSLPAPQASAEEAGSTPTGERTEGIWARLLHLFSSH